MSSNSSKPAFYKNEITEEDIEILKDIFEKIEKDKNAFSFLEPVDYVALNLPDYPKIIKHPMDLGTCKNNLLNGKYKIFQEFMDDLHLIWENCRTYNQQKSEIVKCGNACEKKLRVLIEKKFKNVKHEVKEQKDDQLLSNEDKTELVNKIKEQPNDDLTKIVKIILKNCPDGIEDIDSEKLQIKVDFLRYKDLKMINDFLLEKKEKNKMNNNNNENENSD